MSTKIEWVTNPDGTKGETWNPATGCTKISPGCKNCYAERMARRLAGRYGYPEAPHHFDVTPHPDRLEQPLRWRKPRRVFVCSMGDLFHERISWGFRLSVFKIMERCPQHTFQVLTKRPNEINHWLEHEIVKAQIHWPPPNGWLGVTAEDQKRADERIPTLLQTPAAVRFVSVEPMLGPINLTRIDYGGVNAERCDVLREWYYDRGGALLEKPPEPITLDWAIIGCESGPGRRLGFSCVGAWKEAAIDLVRQCKAAGVKVFVKQVPMDKYPTFRVSHDMSEWPEELRIREYPDGC